MEPVRVVIVDDHAVVREGLRSLLEREPGIEPVDEAASADEAVYRALEHRPDVLLIDENMPGGSGIEAIPKLLQASPETRVLVLTMRDDPVYARAAFAAGAKGYVLKEAAPAELVDAIRQVAGGGSYVNQSLGARLVAADARERAKADADPLSAREHEVLRLLALGHTNQEIARQLSISARTTETHRAHIFQKLSLGSRADLVQYAIQHGLLEEESG